MSFTIRPAQPNELDQILALFPRLASFEIPAWRKHEDLWEGDIPMVKAWAAGELPSLVVIVAVDPSEKVLGVIVASMREELLSHQPSAHIEDLAVAEGAEGQGIGGSLIRALEAEVRARGAQSISLHVFGTNTRARALYQRYGFDEELIRAFKPLS
jgi:ribosomal protein S18 acetylase RimI-like enzyme